MDAVADGEKCECTVEVLSHMGLHARPAAVLARMASGYNAQLSLSKADGSGDAPDCRSILSLLMLAAGKGVKLHLSATGPEAARAASEVAAYFASSFGDEENM
ncbi:MAG: HPr family phosphocarrier protein [Victivallaceae bacterium]|nr:HPr family phosphocarrier protein [Victivallaceae bacterium]